LIAEILERVRHDYMEQPNEEKMKEGALDGMLKALDPYSAYFPPDVYKLFTESAQGEFGGIGLEVLMIEGVLRVISPIDDTPAARAGIIAGDVITHVDGKNLSDMTYVEILKALHGKPGSHVVLTLRRVDQDPIQVTLERAIITINPVKYDHKGDIGVLRISYFNEKTEEKLKEAVDALKNQKALRGIVVDLRNNPGGTLDQALAVTSLFLDGKKKIVEVRGRDPKKNQAYYANGKDILGGIPMIVLINGGSASASEIFAGALQDHKRALIMGKTSVGKGSVQGLFPIQNRGGIKLTISRFYTPENHEIHNKGITPDIVIETAPLREREKTVLLETKVIREDDEVMQRALDIFKGMSLFKK
jgi:carboxyl-terminal processing protease